MLPDSSPAEPDKGWDYSPRERLSGVERGIAKKQDKLSPVFKTTFNDMLKAWPGANIAKRIPVNDIRDLKPLLAEYARIYPEHLPHGVKAVLPAAVSYAGFIERLGGKATHQDWVMANGYGYSSYVERLRMVLVKTGVAERINGDLFNINFNEDLTQANKLITDAIVKKSQLDKQKVSAVLFALVVDPKRFATLLQQLDPN